MGWCCCASERRLGPADRLAGRIREWRDPARAVHTLPAMLRFRMFAVTCRYQGADDRDDLRADALIELAVGRAPERGRGLCSQPIMSRLENAPSGTEVGRLTAALVDFLCHSFASPPTTITHDIGDTCDPVHGHQQLPLIHGHYVLFAKVERHRSELCPILGDGVIRRRREFWFRRSAYRL